MMQVGDAQRMGKKMLDIFGDLRVQGPELDYAAQYYVNNAYPFIDMVDKALTWAQHVQYHFDVADRRNNGQDTLF
jgi:hypothetical protein